MSLPPSILKLSILSPERRPVRLWLPLFLLWPLLLAIGVVAVVLTALADVVLLLLGRRYHRYTVLLLRSLAALGDARGTVVHIKDGQSAVSMTVL